MPNETPISKGRAIDGHDGPVHLDQRKPMPMQGKFARVSDTKDVPYQSSPGTPNKNVD